MPFRVDFPTNTLLFVTSNLGFWGGQWCSCFYFYSYIFNVRCLANIVSNVFCCCWCYVGCICFRFVCDYFYVLYRFAVLIDISFEKKTHYDYFIYFHQRVVRNSMAQLSVILWLVWNNWTCYIIKIRGSIHLFVYYCHHWAR